MLGSSPVLRRRLASLSSMIVDRLSGMKKKMHMAPALKINWIQKFQRHSRKRSTGPPTTPPILVPIQEAKTMNASGHCCSSASAWGKVQIQIKASDSMRIGQRPNSSLHGAHNSHPKEANCSVNWVHALLPGWPGIGEAVVGIFLCQFTLAVLTDVGFLLRVRRAAADTVEWIVGWGEEEERWNRTWGLGKGVKKNASFTMLDITDPK
ncbi:hypothetical protein KC344_g193 [Hortaea werneckii]|nr:hypothetical protein KC344_g193 [Hortaea werneckii]